MSDADRSPMRTGLGTSTEDSITVAGKNLASELMGEVNLGDMAFLVVAGRLPNPQESTLFNAVLVALCDHGLTPMAIATRLTHLGAPDAVQGAIASGLLGAGSVFLGVVENTARVLQEGLEGVAEDDDATLEQLAGRIVADARSHGRLLPGLGHPIHKRGDPRTARLYELADELNLMGAHLRLLRHVATEANRAYGKQLPINAAGAGGAVLSELGFHWSIVRGFAVVSRTAGLVGHLAEEQREPMGRRIWELVEDEATYAPPEGDGHAP